MQRPPREKCIVPSIPAKNGSAWRRRLDERDKRQWTWREWLILSEKAKKQHDGEPYLSLPPGGLLASICIYIQLLAIIFVEHAAGVVVPRFAGRRCCVTGRPVVMVPGSSRRSSTLCVQC